MAPLSNIFKNINKTVANNWSHFKVHMLQNYGENPGNMLIHTGTLGWILSSLAQVGAVVFNDKISPEQKTFLIPQEIADAAINILSFYLLTNSLKKFGAKLVSTGKLRTKRIRSFLERNELMGKVGKLDFNIAEQDKFGPLADHYKSFRNGVDVVTSTVGSIISCNILTPILRNEYASKKQKKAIAHMQKYQTENIQHPKGISIADYQKLASIKFSNQSAGLKI